MELSSKKCIPCEGGEAPLNDDQIASYLSELNTVWEVVDDPETHLQQEFVFDDFKNAMEFVSRVGEIAEEEGHHPDITIHYNKVLIELWTHVIGGLSENDFIIASKIEELI